MAAAGLALVADPSPLAATQQAGAAAGEELDAGRFEILVNGRRVGTEVFAIRKIGSKVRAVGRLQLENGEDPWWPFEVRMQTNANFEPEIYDLRFLAGPTQTVMGRRTENGLLIHTATDAGERFKEFGTASGTLILEHGAAHHFVLMFRRLAADGASARGGTVPIIVPSMNTAATARVSRIDEATRTIAGREVAVTRYDVQLDGRQAEVWVGSGGRVLRVSMPDTGWLATRTEGE
jgi:hypothetical protein